MTESSMSHWSRSSTPRASLAAIGLKLQQLDLFRPIRDQVHIKQKTVRYSPQDKLYDAFISLLAGAHGLVEVNTRVRSDPALQRAFGRTGCAEQSVIQQTLDACDATSVSQMEAALMTIFRQHSRTAQHDYAQASLLLDVDMSGLPSGPKAAFATSGYFARQRQRRGRQLGRVLASTYQEVVVDRLFPGSVQLCSALRPLLEAAERTLDLDEARRRRTIVRVDSGGGSVGDLNWLLARGYQIHGKDYSTVRAGKVAARVRHWVDDPRAPRRQVGWVAETSDAYVEPVIRIAVRCRKRTGGWAYAVLISTVDPLTVLLHAAPRVVDIPDEATRWLLAYVYFYDQRGGGVETANKEDKQGLGITKRQKKREAAQQMVVALGSLAHNVLVWARQWLRETTPCLGDLGLKRLVRDVLTVNGSVAYDQHGHVCSIILNQAHCYARRLAPALQRLVGAEYVSIILGET
ncbi:MAG: transposase [Chloroflexi bacterium]|nr:transposase [Chloroflexota bacterium]